MKLVLVITGTNESAKGCSWRKTHPQVWYTVQSARIVMQM